MTDYILCTGNICPRKNQLTLVRACRKLGLPLLLIGKVLAGENIYANEVIKEIKRSKNMYWIKELPHSSPELSMAYHNSIMFALPSYEEQQPISALEAAAAGKPLLLGDRKYANQDVYSNAFRANPSSEKSIIKSIQQIISAPKMFIPPQHVLNQCRRDVVGQLYASAYNVKKI